MTKVDDSSTPMTPFDRSSDLTGTWQAKAPYFGLQDPRKDLGAFEELRGCISPVWLERCKLSLSLSLRGGQSLLKAGSVMLASSLVKVEKGRNCMDVGRVLFVEPGA